MSGYLDFASTGEPVIDGILQAVESAGDTYHHTESWSEDSPSCIDDINEAARSGASAVLRLREENAQLEAQNSMLREAKCLSCGRSVAPDGDCYGCEKDRLEARLEEAATNLAAITGLVGKFEYVHLSKADPDHMLIYQSARAFLNEEAQT